MNLQSLIDELERRWPHTLRCAWDNDGWMVCRDPEAPVRRVMLALDATAAAIGAAEEAGCDLLLTHHPLLFRPLSSLTPQSLSGRRTLAALAANVSVFSLHTRLDAGDGGVNDALAARLTLPVLGKFGDEESPSLGRLAARPDGLPGEPDAFAAFVRARLGAPFVRRTGARVPARIALVGGSGKDLIGPALAAGADTLVTGEVGYNAALDAAEAGLMILEAGHYFTEAPVLETLAEVCRGTADAACVFYDSNLSAVL